MGLIWFHSTVQFNLQKWFKIKNWLIRTNTQPSQVKFSHVFVKIKRTILSYGIQMWSTGSPGGIGSSGSQRTGPKGVGHPEGVRAWFGVGDGLSGATGYLEGGRGCLSSFYFILFAFFFLSSSHFHWISFFFKCMWCYQKFWVNIVFNFFK